MQVAYFRTVRVRNTVLYCRGVINDNKNPLAILHLGPSMGYFKEIHDYSLYTHTTLFQIL